MRNRPVLLIFLVLLLIAGSVVGWLIVNGPESMIERGENMSATEQTTPKAARTLRFIATGDAIAHDSINQNAKRPDGSYDYLSLMSGMKPFFDRADIRFCNQATPAGGQVFGLSGYPVFNAPLDFTRDLVALGCNVVNIGTNHTNDRGQRLINAAIDEWDRQDILAYGGANRDPAERDKVRYFKAEGVSFAFLAYSTYSNTPIDNGYGVTMYDSGLARRQLAEADRRADIVIVSMRWGTEYSAAVNAEQDRVARELADFGADIVLGHGPHVLQPVKRLPAADGGETLVWFSLGNFLNAQLGIDSLVSGLAVMDIDLDSKKITQVGFMPIYQHYEWTAEQRRREDLSARKGFRMVALDQATDLLIRSLHSTTVSAQTNRINSLLNGHTEVLIMTSEDYLRTAAD